MVAQGKVAGYDLMIMGMDMFDLADFNAGVAAATYKLILPEHWLD
jgi:hypothetical protein